MKNITPISHIKNKIKQTSPLLIFSCIFLLLSILFAYYPQTQKSPIKTSVKGITYKVPTKSPTNIPTRTMSISEANKTTVSSPTAMQAITANLPTAIPPIASNAPHASTPTPSPFLVPTTANASVNMQISEPDGSFTFSVQLRSGNNLCDNLTEAKHEGKIRSLTIDNSYMATLHSAYVIEINGYQNNWTVSVNGKKPQGCSLYSPTPGDTILWKFG